MQTPETIPVYIERQNALVVCKLDPSHVWFFSACYDVIPRLIGGGLKNGECIKLDLLANNIKQIGKYVLINKPKGK